MSNELLLPSKGRPGDNKPTLNNLNIEIVKILRLQTLPRRVRKHSEKQLRKLRRSIDKYGQIVPVIIDDDNNVIDGEAIYLAMLKLGYDEINVIRLSCLSEPDLRTLRLTLNRIQQDTEWDSENLAFELQDLLELEIDLSITGFDAPEIDASFAIIADDTPDEELDTLPLDVPRRASAGQVWQCGEHLLICGDATDASLYAYLASIGAPAMMFSDPPYNVAINGNVCGNGAIKHAEFKMASGEMSQNEFTEFLRRFIEASAAIMPDGALLYLCMDWRHMTELQAAAEMCGLSLINMCVWCKTNAGMGSLYRSQHELVFVFKKGDASHQNNVELGKHGRNRTNVWEYASVNSNDPSRKGDLALHPTVKPVQLVADAILDVTTRKDWVMDPFGGSGTTLLAAELTSRRAMLVEIDPHYCDVTLARFEAMTGIEPEHIGTLGDEVDEAVQPVTTSEKLLTHSNTDEEGPTHGE